MACSAEAGLLSAETMLVQNSGTANHESGSMAAETMTSLLENKIALWLNGPRHELFPHVFAPEHSTSSTSGSPVTTVSAAPAAIASESQKHSSGRLVAYLLRESAILVTPPFLDGIFRPPQCRLLSA